MQHFSIDARFSLCSDTMSGTPGRSFPVSGISYDKIVQEKDPGNNPQSPRFPGPALYFAGDAARIFYFIFPLLKLPELSYFLHFLRRDRYGGP
jgi:hypothetical protein